MDPEQIRALLEQLHAGEITPEAAMAALRWAPFEDLGFARVDTHRQLRTGYPEVVFCQGKSVEQVVGIVRRLAERSPFVLATRASAEHAAALLQEFPEIVHHEAARVLELRREDEGVGCRVSGVETSATPDTRHPTPSPYVLVISAGTSDIPVAEEAAVTAAALGSRVERLYDVGVAGLHRLLHQRELLLGANVLVVVAGMEGALPSVVGGLVERPVIAVPTSVGYGAHFGGLAPLLGMLNSCATGVAVVNIDNGFGAGYFAHLVNQSGGDSRETVVGSRQTKEEGVKGGQALTPGPSPNTGRGGSEARAASDLTASLPRAHESGPAGEQKGGDTAPSELPTTDYRLPSDSVTVIEANLDDLNPQVYEHVMERLFEAGALDVTLTPIQMKKNRPAVTLSVISEPERAGALAEILFAETSTLGVRMSRWERLCLEREWVQVQTPWGAVRVKIGRREGRVLTRTPEYEDCKRVAREAGVPLKQVQAAALAALSD
jgi:pyridinium-3,5-biscarboxylic acid mononucleotide synthase